MANKKEDVIYIEKCIAGIKAGDDIKGNISRLQRGLERLTDTDYEFEVIITKNDNNTFFGANIYPTQDTVDSVVRAILHDKKDGDQVSAIWAENKKWTVELDSILLNDMRLNANPGEITAVLLHEIGHTVYSNSIPQRLHRLIRYKTMKLNYQMRELIADSKISKLFSLAVIESCTTKNFNYINSDKVEAAADQVVLQFGYGEELNSFIDKLIAAKGNGLVNRTDAEIEKDVTSIVNWSLVNVQQLEFRKDKLKDALKVELINTPSMVIKKFVQNIHESFFGSATSTYRKLLSEQYTGAQEDVYASAMASQYLMNHYNKVVKESLATIFERTGKVKKVNQSDIDILRVELDRISNVDDKIYLLDRIYDKMELVDIAINMIDQGKADKVQQSKTTLVSMKRDLQDMRDDVMAMKIVDKDYGVFVRYPKGYKG